MKFQIWLFACMAFFAACNNNPELSYYPTIQAGLSNAKSMIDDKNNSIMHSLANKSKDPVYKDLTDKWIPKAEEANAIAGSLMGDLEAAVTDLKSKAGIQVKEGKVEDIHIDNDAVKEIFITGKRADMLNEKIEKFFFVLDTLDKDIAKDLQPYLNGLKTIIDKKTIERLSAFQAVNLLKTISVNIASAESVVLDYCDRKCHIIIESFDFFSAIISQSSTYIKQGESIEINAGVGAFSRAAQPSVTIDGKIIELNADALAVYKTKTSQSLGAHTIKVVLKYTDPYGKRTEINKDVKYFVAE